MTLFSQTLGSGPDIVLLHGWCLHGGIWEDVAAALAVHNRVTYIDLPGHGRSAALPLADELSAVAEQLAAAAPASAIWIGWSLGGLIALQLALTAPTLVRGLVVVAASPRFVRDTDWPHAVEDAVLQQFARSLDEDYEATLGRFLALQVRGSADAGATLRTLRARVLEQDAPQPAALRSGLKLLRESDLRMRLNDIACPTQFIFGARDLLAPAAITEELSRLMPTARCDVIEGAGHAPFVSHAAQFIDLIGTSLRE
jgi:pimeloyl-[acyl-carrier protein] methyl ester esterase